MTTDTNNIHVIIVAAGIGQRFQSSAEGSSDTPKQYQMLGQSTVLEHSIQAFDGCEVSGITVVIHPQDKGWQNIQPITSKHPIQSAMGGSQRHDSVRNGIKSLKAHPHDWVLVHDAARPCVTHAEIQDLITQCTTHQQGGLLVRALTDTIKYSEDAKHVKKTINREQLFAALTPQMFRCGDLLKALTVFEADSITDESSAIESQGQKPLMVTGKQTNIKITNYEDLLMANNILQQQGRLK